MLGALIGAAGSLLGGILGNKSRDDAAEKNIAYQRENAARQEALQREFAQSGIQWKVEDARKAGIHPLYALGASTTSYAPSTVGNVYSGEDSLASAVASSSQDIGRAVTATQSDKGRDAMFVKTSQALQLEKFGLENELLKTQIAKMRGQIGPPMPTLASGALIDGQPATAVRTVSGAPVSADKIEQAADTIPAKARIRPAGVKLYTNPWTSDAQDVEDRYGETVSDWVVGPGNLIADGLYTGYIGSRSNRRSHVGAPKYKYYWSR